MYDGPTLASIPADAHWVFRSTERAVLCLNEVPVAIHVHGSIKKANVFAVGHGVEPSVEIWMWSVEEAKIAAQLFGTSAEGACNGFRSRTATQASGLQKPSQLRCSTSLPGLPPTRTKRCADQVPLLMRADGSQQRRGYFFHVYDGTNPAGPSTLPTIHPGTVNEGDFVRLTTHLVLVANVQRQPKYVLHLEELTVLALQPDDVARVL